MIRIALCDDTIEYSRAIHDLLVQWGRSRATKLMIDCFDNGDALLSALAKQPYDLVFLDIIMPMLSGIDTCAEIRKENRQTKVIFVSVSTEFGADAFRVKADNYLLKPVDPARLFEVMDEYLAEVDTNDAFLVVKTATMVRKVPLHTITHLEAQNKQVLIFTTGNDVLTSTTPLHQIAQSLTPPFFFQCHRSYIVNMNEILSYTKKQISVRNGYTIPIARNSVKEFHDAYFRFLFGKAGEQ